MGTYDVDQSLQGTLPILDQLSSVMLLPLLLVVSKIARECLLTPGTLGWVRDGGPGADTLVGARVLEVQSQGTVTAHGVARDGDAGRVKLLEVIKDELGELLAEIGLHVVVLAPGVLLGVDVEAGGATKVPRLVLAGEVEATGRRVGVEKGEAQRSGVGVEEALFRDIVGGAGEAGEVDEKRSWLGG